MIAKSQPPRRPPRIPPTSQPIKCPRRNPAPRLIEALGCIGCVRAATSAAMMATAVLKRMINTNTYMGNTSIRSAANKVTAAAITRIISVMTTIMTKKIERGRRNVELVILFPSSYQGCIAG